MAADYQHNYVVAIYVIGDICSFCKLCSTQLSYIQLCNHKLLQTAVDVHQARKLKFQL